MPLYRYNGVLLVRYGALATSEACCCGGCTTDEDCKKWCRVLAQGIVAGGYGACNPTGIDGCTVVDGEWTCVKYFPVPEGESCSPSAETPYDCSTDSDVLDYIATLESACPDYEWGYSISCVGYCCDGACQPTACCHLCVYPTAGDCLPEEQVWNWDIDMTAAQCADYADSVYHETSSPVTIPGYTIDTSAECNDPQVIPPQDIDPCTGDPVSANPFP